ncbi:LuxR family transcriptional regulator [Burkholderia pseudomallei]|nr:LuxR family transcriptional regulator [Burkholderia pseudomallei]
MNSPVTTSQETVFVVDDDEAVRDSLRWLLEANGYRVQCFSSAEQFLDAYQPAQQAGQIACLILDVRMSGMSGLELQERLIAENAALPIIFVTGHGDVPMAVSTMKKGAMDFIEKPFDEAELRKHARHPALPLPPGACRASAGFCGAPGARDVRGSRRLLARTPPAASFAPRARAHAAPVFPPSRTPRMARIHPIGVG